MTRRAAPIFIDDDMDDQEEAPSLVKEEEPAADIKAEEPRKRRAPAEEEFRPKQAKAVSAGPLVSEMYAPPPPSFSSLDPPENEMPPEFSLRMRRRWQGGWPEDVAVDEADGLAVLRVASGRLCQLSQCPVHGQCGRGDLKDPRASHLRGTQAGAALRLARRSAATFFGSTCGLVQWPHQRQ